MQRHLLFLMLLFMPAPSWAGESWPQFRGPDGQGHADAVGLPVTWSDDENVTWKTAIAGRGWSSPVVDGDRIWLTTALDDGRSLHALCIDRASGRIVHDEHVFNIDEPAKINAKNSYASPTPVIEGDRVWVHFGTYGTACLDSRSGKILWTNNELKLDHKEGPGSSPILVGNLLVVNCDGMDVQYVVALDKRTGSIVWKAERSGRKNADPDLRKAYSTPLAIDVAGRKQIVSVGADRASAYDAATGAELWYVDFEGFSNVPRPLFAGGLVILDTGYMKPQLWAIRPDGAGDVTESHIVWRVKNQVPANPSPVVVDQNLYMVSDQGVLTCLEVQTGKERFKSRLGGNFSASPISAAGNVYFFSEEGETTVTEASAELKEVARNRLPGRIMASPAVAGRAIYLRTDTHLYRIEQSAADVSGAAP
ncbi:MAG TPA: PQQ-binding-like beta-propeller repeat protein [Pirellulales bacterium]